MKKTLIFILILSQLIYPLALTAFCYEFFPTPTITGSTGLARIPTADVIPYKNFNMAFDGGAALYYNSEEDKNTSKGTMFFKMNLGTFQNLELGFVGGTDYSQEKIREGVFINMKYSLSTDSSPYPLLLAIGVENLASYNQADVYMVATKYFQDGPKVTFGFMGDFPGDKFRPLGMFGLGFPVWGNMMVMGDALAGEVLFQFDLGIRYYFSPTFTMNVNGINIFENQNNPQGKDQKSILIGFSWANPF